MKHFATNNNNNNNNNKSCTESHMQINKSSGHIMLINLLIISYIWATIHPFRVDNSSTGLWLGLRQGAFTCVRWQVTLCDPIWQVTLCNSEMKFH